MMRKLMVALVVCGSIAAGAETAAAQEDAFTPGTTYIGPTLGLGGIGSASLSFGGRFERGVKKLPELGSGTLGILVGINYYSWSDSGSYIGGSWSSSVKYIPVGVTANYHFVLQNKKLDPFVGAGLGYQVVSSSCTVSGFDCGGTSSSALYFIARAGGQYRFTDKVGLYADAGAGDAALNVGAMFRMR